MQSPWRVTLTWAPSRLQRGPYTGRGAKPAGLVSGRTRLSFRFSLNAEPAFKLKSLLDCSSRLFVVTRQRPTFPLPRSSSIIGLGGLNFRVRDGNGCGPSGKATGDSAKREL